MGKIVKSVLRLDEVKVKLDKGAIMPIHAHESDAGYDLCAPCLIMIPAHRRVVVDTGVHMSIPEGYYGRLESKSGIMKDKGITARGTIDSGYTGSIKVVLFNHSDDFITFNLGDKITQIVFLACQNPELVLVDEFDSETERSENGFGSTGE